MPIAAAVVRERGGPFVIESLSLTLPPQPHEVLVKIVATGICRTDLHMRDGEYEIPPAPFVGGHEGAGVVVDVGPLVTSVQPGDRVLLSYPSCGVCDRCTGGMPPYCRSGVELSFAGRRLDGTTALLDEFGAAINGHVFQQSSSATHVLVPERNVVPVPVLADSDLAVLAPLGCGFQTGAGAVFNSLRPGRDAQLVVIGAGSVGLAAIMAARILCLDRIIAVDRDPTRLAVAARVGATDTLAADAFAEAVLDLCPHGVAGVVETTAAPQNVADGVRILDSGGVLVLLGGARIGTAAPVDLTTLLNGRSLRGVIQGDAVPQDFIPRLIRHYQDGEFPIGELVTYYPFERIGDAVRDMQTGAVIKPVLMMSP